MMATAIENIPNKKPLDSTTVMTEVVYPNDTNPMGMLQGGRLIQWMDTASAVCAQLHAERIAVTVSLNKVKFKQPARTGDIISITAKITRAFDTSMEIFVSAKAKKVLSPEQLEVGEAYFTFVAIDENGKPAIIPKLVPQNTIEKAAYKSALLRKMQQQTR